MILSASVNALRVVVFTHAKVYVCERIEHIGHGELRIEDLSDLFVSLFLEHAIRNS